MDKALGIGLDNVSKMIDGKASGLATSLRSAVIDATTNMDETAQRAIENVASKGLEYTDEMAARSAGFSNSLASHSEEFARTLAERAEEFDGSSTTIPKVSRAPRQAARKISPGPWPSAPKRFAGRLTGDADAFASILVETSAKVTAEAAAVQQSLDATEKALGARHETIRATLDDRTRELNSMLAARSTELARLIDEKAQPALDSFADLGREAAEKIGAAALQGAAQLRSENSNLVAAITARTEETARALSSTEQSLKDTVTGLIGALDQSNTGIQKLVEDAASNLGAVDQNLSAVADRFAESTNKVSDSIHASTRLLEGKADRLSSVSGDTLQQIANIVGRFDDHSKVLGQASDLLGAAQSNLVTTLEEREDALQSLAVGLVHRSEEIENTMRSLAGLVEAAFDRAESRSGQVSSNLKGSVQASFVDIGKILADTEKRASDIAENMKAAVTGAAEEASIAVEGTLGRANERAEDVASRLRASVSNSLSDVDRLLGETGKRSISTASQMRDALKEAVEDAVNRFTGATEEIRRTAGEIRKELNDTRAELKRGAFDLPEEAKESAAQMRRAVAEQVKALQELSGIIGVSSAHLETPRGRSEQLRDDNFGTTALREPEAVVRRQAPVMQQPVQTSVVRQPEPAQTYRAPVAEPVMRAEPVRQPEPEQPVRRAEPEQPVPRQPQADQSRAEPTGLRGSLGIERQPVVVTPPAATLPVRAASPERAQPVERPARQEPPRLSEGQGWITDLLRNASMGDDDGRGRTAAASRCNEPGHRPAARGSQSAPCRGIAELAVGRYRPRHRPRRLGRSLAPLPARRARRLHPPPLYAQGPADLRRDQAQIRPRAGVPHRRRSLHRAISKSCSPTSPATIATRC